jgi:hypothetical protein
MESKNVRSSITPAQAGVENQLNTQDSLLCGNDMKRGILAFCGIIIFLWEKMAFHGIFRGAVFLSGLPVDGTDGCEFFLLYFCRDR